MTRKIFIGYSKPEDEFGKDIILGKCKMDCEEDISFTTDSKAIKNCQRAILLVSPQSKDGDLLQELERIKQAKIPLYITQVHPKHSAIVNPEIAECGCVHEWSLDKIMEFIQAA